MTRSKWDYIRYTRNSLIHKKWSMLELIHTVAMLVVIKALHELC